MIGYYWTNNTSGNKLTKLKCRFMFHVKCFSHHFSCFSLFSMFMTILLWLTQSGFLVLRPNFGRRLASHSTVVCIGALFTSFPIVAGSGSLSRSRLLYFSISRLAVLFRHAVPNCGLFFVFHFFGSSCG